MEDTRENPARTVLRQIRTSLVDVFVALAKTIFFWIPGEDIAKGKALMACHPIFIGLIIALFFILTPKSPLRLLIILLGITTVASQWLLGGCVITRAEQQLTGSKDTIVDPFLRLAGIQVNRDTRLAATLGSGTSICVLMVWSFLCDFIKL